MKKIRIAVVGAGYIGLAHIDVLVQSTSCELSAIVDPQASAKTLANQLGVPYYVSLSDLLALEKPDGIVLATPNALHVPNAIECIASGIPILLEKPIAPTVEEAHALVDLVEKSGAKVLIGHHRAHSPIMAKAREVIQNGALGKLVAITGTATFYKPDEYFNSAPWRTQVGAGPILLNLIHEIHNLRMLCGEIIAVQAFASNATRNYPVEDTVSINLRFANGVLGSFLLSDTAASPRSWEQTSQENKAYTSYPEEDCYVVSGVNGSLSIPTMRLKTYPNPESRSWWKPFDESVVAMQRDDPLIHQMQHFAEVIKGNALPIVSAKDGLANLQVTEAIAKAAKTGATVEVSLL